jgi:RNA polymerase sigma factor (sigma-70 family)
LTAPGESAGHRIFAEVIKQEGRIRRVLARRGVPAVFHDDLTQEVLLVAWRIIDTGRFRGSAGPMLARLVNAWLGAIAANTASHFLGSRYYRRWKADTPESRTECASVEPDPEAQRVYWDVLDAIDRLSVEHREVVLLTAAGLSAVEIGVLLGTPGNTVSSRLRQARGALRRGCGRWRR